MHRTARLWVLVSLLTLALLGPVGGASAVPDDDDGGEVLLPDLAMARLRHIGTTRRANGQRFLRFSTIIVNVGEGPFELRSKRSPGSPTWSAEQVLHKNAGPSQAVPVSKVKLVYEGDGHDHWHVHDLERYELVPQPPGGQRRIGKKVGFCFFDNYGYGLELPGAPEGPGYGEAGCGTRSSVRLRTGLSVGWGDIYHRSLPGQYIDITGLPSGRYRLKATADHDNLFTEQDDDNNSTWADLWIRERGMAVLGRAPSP
jgi:Lysyl oxidase